MDDRADPVREPGPIDEVTADGPDGGADPDTELAALIASLREQPPAPFVADEPGRSMVKRAHQRHGIAGAFFAAGLLGIDEALGRRKKDTPAAVAESPGEPGDIDRDGITVDVDDERVVRSRVPSTHGRQVVKRRRTR